jgi:hypothetical protein
MSGRPTPDVDAALVLGMASTALPFARTPAAEAERWLRILRLHGEAGTALQALGVSEAPIEGDGSEDEGQAAGTPGERRDVIAAVTEEATEIASARGAPTVTAGDVLVAAMQFYGEDFDRVLRVHGTDRDEVLERLGMDPARADA